MIFRQVLRAPGAMAHGAEKHSDFLMSYLNEIERENIVQIVPDCGANGTRGYVVFYEDENIYACPGCGHHISNTFSYCPNCAHKMDPSIDAPLKCSTCNKDVAYTFEFCPHCANKLK